MADTTAQNYQAADARILKAQLDPAAEVRAKLWLLSPLRAAAFAFIGSSAFGLFGNVPLTQTLILPLLVALASAVSFLFVRAYKAEVAVRSDLATMRKWYHRSLGLHVFVACCWGSLAWVMWEPGNAANHLYIFAVNLILLAGTLVTRVSHSELLVARMVPLIGLTTLRFAFGDLSIDIFVALALPFFTFQFIKGSSGLVKRNHDDTRLRFQVEEMARELEEARDDALRKRFEAETANASKTAFLANMSHELRTPLNAILGFSEIIAQECFGPVGSTRYKEYAADIHSSGAHLLSLINDLLDVAKIEAGKMDIHPHPLDAQHTFNVALKLVGIKARDKRQNLTVDVDEHAPPLYADERALKQILINLVSNAVKFTPEGGRISVHAGQARGGGFQITVKDNGPGIPRDKLDRIFQPFSQVDNRYDRQAGGTGLGLALVRGLVDLHGGRAWLESEPGKGCTVYVVLPEHQDDLLSENEGSTAAA